MSLAPTAADARPAVGNGGVTAGILLLLGAVACFACLDASAKWINLTGNAVQTSALRTIVSFVLVGAAGRPWRRSPATGRPFTATRSPLLQVVRGLCIVAATLCSFSALRFLPLTQATAISFGAPLITAVLAGPLVGEWPGPHRLAAVGVGFLGVMVVTRPWSAGFDPAMVLALLTALFNSLYAMATRVLAPRDPPLTTIFYAGAVGTLVMLPALAIVWSPSDDPRVWLVLLGLGTFGAVGHWLLILAHERAPASTLAPFFYAQLIGAAALGWLVFGNLPDLWTVVGGLIVAGSGLYLLHRERVRRGAPSADVAV